jgi:hypothetical protein
MIRALIYKELRETVPFALVAMAGLALLAAAAAGGVSLGLHEAENIPFLAGTFVGYVVFVGLVLALVLGTRQSVWESTQGTWLFLLHRPTARKSIAACKLAVGLSVYLAAIAVPILGYALWAQTPGHRPAPFYWSMTEPAWKSWAAISLVYLGTFLTGLRPGRWLGTRLFPLFAAGFLALILGSIPWWLSLGLPALVLVNAMYIAAILHVLSTRDFG